MTMPTPALSGADPHSLAIVGAQVVVLDELRHLDIGIAAGVVQELAPTLQQTYARTLDAKGLVALPGLVDTQVHLREPGLEHKEDLATGTNAAAAGGVTTVFEMPNTRPPTTDQAAWHDKVQRALGRARVDFAFYAGATADNADELRGLEGRPGYAGTKIFMGSSTGTLLVPDDAGVRAHLRSGRMRVAVHAEDEQRLRQLQRTVPATRPHDHPDRRDTLAATTAVRRLLDLCIETMRPVHVLHVTSADECELLRQHPGRRLATGEVTPQHLLLSAPECYDRLGNLAVMNPPIRSEDHRLALWAALRDGTLTLIGTDHAPHTMAEKARPYPDCPSGMPGLQTLLPLLLDQAARGNCSLAEIARWTAQRPAQAFQIQGKGGLVPGLDADVVLCDLQAVAALTPERVQSRCGWSPFLGQRLRGWPVYTLVRGQIVFAEGQLVGAPLGRPVKLGKPLPIMPGR